MLLSNSLEGDVQVLDEDTEQVFTVSGAAYGDPLKDQRGISHPSPSAQARPLEPSMWEFHSSS